MLIVVWSGTLFSFNQPTTTKCETYPSNAPVCIIQCKLHPRIWLELSNWRVTPLSVDSGRSGHKTSIVSFLGSCAGEEEREPGTHCSHMRQPVYYSATLKLRSISVYLLEACTTWLYSCGIHTGGFEVKNLTVTVCIASFEVIGELQRVRLPSVTCRSV